MPNPELQQQLVLFHLLERFFTRFLNWALLNPYDTPLQKCLKKIIEKMDPIEDPAAPKQQFYHFFVSAFENFLLKQALEVDAPANLDVAWRRSPKEINLLLQDLKLIRHLRNMAMHGRNPGEYAGMEWILTKVHSVFRTMDTYLLDNAFAFAEGRVLVLSKEQLAGVCRGEAIVSSQTVNVGPYGNLRFVQAPTRKHWCSAPTPSSKLHWPDGGTIWVSADPMKGAKVDDTRALSALNISVGESGIAEPGLKITSRWSAYYPVDWETDLFGLPRWESNRSTPPKPYPWVMFSES